METPAPSSDLIDQEPYYLSSSDEIDLFAAAFRAKLPVLLKGPTGCGKTRFVRHMAWRLKRPLVTVACHEDLFASDLLGRYLLQHDQTVWVDGPLTRAVRTGAICYLDEIVEARKDKEIYLLGTAHVSRQSVEQVKTLITEQKPDTVCVELCAG
ncbi:MAG: AAA family ATPase, partial [Desulfosarcinaceae bacterium]